MKIIGTLILAVLIVLGVYIGLASRDIPEPDTSDLAIDRPVIAPEDNAFTYFAAATNEFNWPGPLENPQAYLRGESADEQQLREFIDGNRKIIELIRRGVKCEICLAPEVQIFNELRPYISLWRRMGKFLAIKTKHDRLAGKHAEATETCCILLQFSNMTQADTEILIDYVVGIALLNIGLIEARDIISDQNTTQQELKQLSTVLADLGPFDSGLSKAMKGEYRFASNTIDLFKTGGFNEGKSTDALAKLGYMFQPNRTKLMFADLYRGSIQNISLYYGDMQMRNPKEVLGLNQSRLLLYLQPNSIGKILAQIMLISIDKLLNHKCEVECHLAATRLLVALQMYKNDKGEFPLNLQTLVPDYIKALPTDPFDGQAFRYLPEKGIIYSVGKDLQDDGGSRKLLEGETNRSPYLDKWNAEDIVFKIDKPDS